jgi:hypothetical protein
MVQKKVFSGVLYSAIGAVPVVSNSLTAYDKCRSVWIGTTQSLDFSFDGVNWITFQGCTAGTELDIQVLAARITAGSANPAAGDVVFLY